MIFTSLEFKGKLYTYQTVKAVDITCVLVNGAPLVERQALAQLVTNTFA